MGAFVEPCEWTELPSKGRCGEILEIQWLGSIVCLQTKKLRELSILGKPDRAASEYCRMSSPGLSPVEAAVSLGSRRSASREPAFDDRHAKFKIRILA